MDAEPKTWTRTCEGARQLRQDLANGIVKSKNAKPSLIQPTREVYLAYTKTRFAANLRNSIADFEAVSQLGEEVVM